MLDNTLYIHTDGSCSGNPGPCGCSAILVFNNKIKKMSEPLGIGTNNIAELSGIKLGLSAVKKHTDYETIVYTDSQYAINILTKGWKAKKNIELVNDIKELIKEFRDIKFEHVYGHNGDIFNEECDKLAKKASGVL